MVSFRCEKNVLKLDSWFHSLRNIIKMLTFMEFTLSITLKNNTKLQICRDKQKVVSVSKDMTIQ